MKLKLSDIANRINGTLIGENLTVTNLVTDSRQVTSGCIFAAIKGERVDGFDFIPELDHKYSVAYLTDRELHGVKNPYILTNDVVKAIGSIASLHLDTLSAKHIAVTGSVGKTTTKNYIASALATCMPVHFTKGNFNNELGLPLTALGTTDEHKAVILEMGMRGMGQIEYLCNIARPDVAVITNIGICHIELLGSRENILKAKCEVIDALSETGIAVINADDDMLKTLNPKVKTLRFGIDNEKCDIRALDVVDNKFTLKYNDESYPVVLSTLGRHNIYNALAAVSVGIALGCDIRTLISGVENFSGDGSRQNIYEYEGFRIFDDTYNASPASMSASMQVMGGFAGRHILVLADMLELGDYSVAAHASLAKDIRKINADVVICIGSNMKYLYNELEGINAYSVSDNTTALELLIKNVKKGDNILFKGSNSMRLCDLLEDFKGEFKK